jgi:hypothetical protein
MKRRFWLGCGIVAVLLVFITAGLFFFTPFGKEFRAMVKIQLSGKRTYAPESCLANLKQVGQALQLYMNSNAAYPPSGCWVDELSNYVTLGNDVKDEDREKVFKCPGVFTENPKNYGYAMNLILSSKSSDEVKDLANSVFVFDSAQLTKNAANSYETKNLPLPPRHGAVNNVVHSDGSAKSVTAVQM